MIATTNNVGPVATVRPSALIYTVKRNPNTDLWPFRPKLKIGTLLPMV